MLAARNAEEMILELVHPLTEQDAETVDLLAARGRILADEIASPLDFPHWDNSAMDGYAVRYDDVQTATADQPMTLHVVEEIAAGGQPQQAIAPGEAARIFTGAVMPDGADTVVMQEETRQEGDRVIILSAPAKPGNFVRKQGTYAKAGDLLLSAGCPLAAAEIAILAAAQCSQVTVFRRPRVAILSTGDELVPINQSLQPGQIVDSNRYALASLVSQIGCEPVLMGIVPDQPEALKSAIAQALAAADVVISSGGVSVGEYDYVDQILTELGATIHVRSVAVKPGKPLTVASFSDFRDFQNLQSLENPRLYFGLPGNPVSALVTFWRFVVPALRKLSGLPEPWQPIYVNAIARHPLNSDRKRETYVWGELELVDGYYTFAIAGGSQTSGNLINLAGANGLAVVPLGDAAIAAGDIVQVLLMK
jgi:molybdopterin molybdotransferase